jgi:nucleoside 2-deoxyribosyltransferase
MIIYLAHPISGLSYDAVTTYYEATGRQLRGMGYKVLHPMLGKEHLRTEKEFRALDYRHPVSTNHAIIERDAWMVDRADIVLVDLRDTDTVSIGCMMELAWAYRQHKHTIVILPEDNVHRHAFVLEAADIVFGTLAMALLYLGNLAKEQDE